MRATLFSLALDDVVTFVNNNDKCTEPNEMAIVDVASFFLAPNHFEQTTFRTDRINGMTVGFRMLEYNGSATISSSTIHFVLSSLDLLRSSAAASLELCLFLAICIFSSVDPKNLANHILEIYDSLEC